MNCTDVGSAVRRKSPMFTVTIIEWDNDPLVPVTVTVKTPNVEEPTVSVDAPVPPEPSETLEGLNETVRPE